MRDAAILLILLGLIWLAWLRPWLGVLGLAVLGIMHPQSYGGEGLATLPVYKILFLSTLSSAGYSFWRDKRWPTFFWDWRFAVIALLALDFLITTHYGLLPLTSRDRLPQMAMLVLPWLPMLLLIDTREKFTWLIATMALSIALVALKGGYWAVMTGFQDRVYGPPNTQIGGNNEFAVALAMTIPLMVFWLRQIREHQPRLLLMGLIALAYVAALTSWSRGGLVALAAMTALLIWHSRRKYLALPILALGAALAFVNLPEKWHERMGTLASFQHDESFQSRVWAWERGMEFVRQDPLTGVGLDGWKQVNVFEGDTPSALDWHNAYVEIAAEHGIPGLVLWLALLLGTLVSLTLLIDRDKRRSQPWASDAAAMLRASLVAFAVGGISLGTAYWELLYLVLGLAILSRRLSLAESEAKPPP